MTVEPPGSFVSAGESFSGWEDNGVSNVSAACSVQRNMIGYGIDQPARGESGIWRAAST